MTTTPWPFSPCLLCVSVCAGVTHADNGGGFSSSCHHARLISRSLSCAFFCLVCPPPASSIANGSGLYGLLPDIKMKECAYICAFPLGAMFAVRQTLITRDEEDPTAILSRSALPHQYGRLDPCSLCPCARPARSRFYKVVMQLIKFSGCRKLPDDLMNGKRKNSMRVTRENGLEGWNLCVKISYYGWITGMRRKRGTR